MLNAGGVEDEIRRQRDENESRIGILIEHVQQRRGHETEQRQRTPIAILTQNRVEICLSEISARWMVAAERPPVPKTSKTPVTTVTIATKPKSAGIKQTRQHDDGPEPEQRPAALSQEPRSTGTNCLPLQAFHVRKVRDRPSRAAARKVLLCVIQRRHLSFASWSDFGRAASQDSFRAASRRSASDWKRLAGRRIGLADCRLGNALQPFLTPPRVQAARTEHAALAEARWQATPSRMTAGDFSDFMRPSSRR